MIFFILVLINNIFCQEFTIQTTHNREIISFDENQNNFLTSSLDGEIKLWDNNYLLQVRNISYNNEYTLIKTYFLDSNNLISFYGNSKVILTDLSNNSYKEFQLDIISVKFAAINQNNKIFVSDGNQIKVYDLIDILNGSLKSITIKNDESILNFNSYKDGILATLESKVVFIDQIGKISNYFEINELTGTFKFFDEYILNINDQTIKVFINNNENLKEIKEYTKIKTLFSNNKNLFIFANDKLTILDKNLRSVKEISIDIKGINRLIGSFENKIIFESYDKSLSIINYETNEIKIVKNEINRDYQYLEYDINNNNLVLRKSDKIQKFNLESNSIEESKLENLKEQENDEIKFNPNIIISKLDNNFFVYDQFELTLVDKKNNVTFKNILNYNLSNDKFILVSLNEIVIYDFTSNNKLYTINPKKKLTRNSRVTNPILIKDNLFFTIDNVMYEYSISNKVWKIIDIPTNGQCVSVTSIKNNIIALLYHNGEIQFYSTQTKEFFMKLLMLKNNEWVAINNKNFFNGSKNGIAKITINQNNSAQKLDNLYESNLDLDIFNFLNYKTKKIEKKTEILKDKSFLEITNFDIVSPIKNEVNRPNINFTFDIKSNKTVKTLRLYLNNKLFYFEEYNIEVKLNTIKNVKLKLENGKNIISVQLTDYNNIKSNPIEYSINYIGKKISKKLYVLSIGDNSYKSLPTLKYAQKDAEDFSNVFKSKQNNFDDISINNIAKKILTKDNIISSLSSIKSKISPNDVFVFYFAGHGVYDSTYKIAVNNDLIPMDLILNALGNFNSANIILFIDACYSGQVINSIDEYSKYLTIAQNKINFNLYTSSFFEPSFEFKGVDNGIFTHFALKCLNGDFTNKEGRIGTNELSYYLKDKYPKFIKENIAKKINPIIINNGENIILK